MFSRLLRHGGTHSDTRISVSASSTGWAKRYALREIGRVAILFLGHVLGRGKVSPQPKATIRTYAAKCPETKPQVRPFLGLAGYYREFIPRYAEATVPLTELTKKGRSNKVEWMAAHGSAVKQLKARFSKELILKLSNFEKGFVLLTDPSYHSLGPIVLQEHRGTLLPVAYASRKPFA